MDRIGSLTALALVGILLAACSLLGAPTIPSQPSSSMPSIDSSVVTMLEKAGGEPIQVLIVCDESCDPVLSALKREGIAVTNTGSVELGSIGASINQVQLDKLKSIPGITAVEFDQDVHMFDSN